MSQMHWSQLWLQWTSFTVEQYIGIGLKVSPYLLRRTGFIIFVSAMSSSGGGSIHVFVKSYDFAIMDCKDMGKVTAELPTGKSNTPGVMTQSHDFVTLSDKLSWLKMLNLLSVYQRCEELPHLFLTSAFPRKWHILYFG